MSATEAFRAQVRAITGGDPGPITPGKLHRFGTCSRASDRAGWAKLFDDERGGVFGCNRQGIHETWSAVDRRKLTPAERAEWARQTAQARREREEQQREQLVGNARRNLRLQAECRRLVLGDSAALYLKRRLLAPLWPAPAALLFHPAMPYWHEGAEVGRLPALVARITSPAGDLLALHRTYLTRDGRKADVPGPVKKVTAASGHLIGGCIRLGQPRDGVIAIAEGIETALAASMASGLPVVAAYSAGALAGWVWPAGVQSLVIFADADKAGREAADRLRQRAQAGALRVNVMTPTTEGLDWCDVWAARDASPVAHAFDQLHDFEPANRDEVTRV